MPPVNSEWIYAWHLPLSDQGDLGGYNTLPNHACCGTSSINEVQEAWEWTTENYGTIYCRRYKMDPMYGIIEEEYATSYKIESNPAGVDTIFKLLPLAPVNYYLPGYSGYSGIYTYTPYKLLSAYANGTPRIIPSYETWLEDQEATELIFTAGDESITTKKVTAEANTIFDTFISYGHGLSNDALVEIQMISPANSEVGLTLGDMYYVINSTPSDFQLSASKGGSNVSILEEATIKVEDTTNTPITAGVRRKSRYCVPRNYENRSAYKDIPCIFVATFSDNTANETVATMRILTSWYSRAKQAIEGLDVIRGIPQVGDYEEDYPWPVTYRKPDNLVVSTDPGFWEDYYKKQTVTNESPETVEYTQLSPEEYSTFLVEQCYLRPC